MKNLTLKSALILSVCSSVWAVNLENTHSLQFEIGSGYSSNFGSGEKSYTMMPFQETSSGTNIFMQASYDFHLLNYLGFRTGFGMSYSKLTSPSESVTLPSNPGRVYEDFYSVGRWSAYHLPFQISTGYDWEKWGLHVYSGPQYDKYTFSSIRWNLDGEQEIPNLPSSSYDYYTGRSNSIDLSATQRDVFSWSILTNVEGIYWFKDKNALVLGARWNEGMSSLMSNELSGNLYLREFSGSVGIRHLF